MFREPEKMPCATATEIPNSRLLNTSMMGAGGFTESQTGGRKYANVGAGGSTYSPVWRDFVPG